MAEGMRSSCQSKYLVDVKEVGVSVKRAGKREVEGRGMDSKVRDGEEV